MQSIGSFMQNNPMLQKRFEEHKQRLLNDNDIREFLDRHDELIDETMLEKGLSTLNEFIVRRNDPHHKPELIIANGNISILYKVRDITLAQRYDDKIIATQQFDKDTIVWRGYTLADFEPRPGNSAALGFAKDFCQSYRYGQGFTGMWLCGLRGIGKSYLMACMTGELAKRNVGVTFVSMSNLLSDIQDRVKDFSLNKNKELDKYRKAEVLILDDIGQEYLTEWHYTQYFRPIIEHRMQHKLATFFTSNFTIEEYRQNTTTKKGMTQDHSEYIKTRLNTLAVEVKMTGTDRRPKA